MLNNGDKIVVKKKIANFLKEGDIAKVVDVNEDGMISFAFGEDFVHMGVMTSAEFEEHFEKLAEEKNAPTITQEYIDEIIENSEFTMTTAFDKCTIVACKLPNGFVIVESSACVSPENYDENMGIDICLSKIEDKIWELEGYRLQQHLWETESGACDCNCEDCDECLFDEFYEEEFEEELSCDDCEDTACPYHPVNNK